MLKIDNLREWEKIQKVVRKHWIVYVFLSLYLFIWISVSLSLLSFFWWNNIIYIILIIFWQVFLLFLYMEWLNYELDIFVITDSRVIWLHQLSFLDRTISECNLWQVQEVQASTKWLLSNLLNYWKITIQTAWNASNFFKPYAPDVINVARDINNLANNYKEYYRKKEWDVSNIEKKDL